MSDRVILLPLATIEGRHLLGLIDEFLHVIDLAQHDADDGAARRLTPDPYPEDRLAGAEFADQTRDDLLDRRMHDALRVRRGLSGFDVDDDPAGGDALLPRDVLIEDDELDAWLRTLTAMRLVMASRLGVDGVEAPDPDDPRLGVYDWLGYRLDGLVQAADEHDL
ncbi:MAG: DUF2017 family protein [Microbacterium sp.]